MLDGLRQLFLREATPVEARTAFTRQSRLHAQDAVSRRHHADRVRTHRLCRPPGRSGTAPSRQPHPLPRRVGAESSLACRDHPGRARQRRQAQAAARRLLTDRTPCFHDLGTATQARIQHRRGDLCALRRTRQGHRVHRRPKGHRQNTGSSARQRTESPRFTTAGTATESPTATPWPGATGNRAGITTTIIRKDAADEKTLACGRLCPWTTRKGKHRNRTRLRGFPGRLEGGINSSESKFSGKPDFQQKPNSVRAAVRAA